MRSVKATLQGFDDEGHYTGLYDDQVDGYVTADKLAALLRTLPQDMAALSAAPKDVCPPNLILQDEHGRKILSISCLDPEELYVLHQDPHELSDDIDPVEAGKLFIEKYGTDAPGKERSPLPTPRSSRAGSTEEAPGEAMPADAPREVIAWELYPRIWDLAIFVPAVLILIALVILIDRGIISSRFMWDLARYLPVGDSQDEAFEGILFFFGFLPIVAVVTWVMYGWGWSIVADHASDLVIAKKGRRRVAQIRLSNLARIIASDPSGAPEVAGAPQSRSGQRSTIWFIDSTGRHIRALELPNHETAKRLVRQANVAIKRWRRARGRNSDGREVNGADN